MAIQPLRLDTRRPKPSLIGRKVRGRYFVESRIGGGTFGEVYLVVDLESSLRVDGHVRRAMKVIDVADPDPPRIPPPDYVNQQLSHATREIYYHHLVSSHPNIVTLHEWFLIANREEMFLILDYCSGGDLRTYISKGRDPLAGDDRRMRQIVLQICDAVNFIHSKGVFHKDLKPQNILISKDGSKVFLCDFGLATDVRTDARGGGTTPYMSPGNESHPLRAARLLTHLAEILNKTGFYCPQRADAWTLGIIILNMLGLSPWDGASTLSRRFRNFMLVDDHLLKDRPISLEANDLIRDILRFHPKLRLSIPEIFSRVLHLRSFFNCPRTRSTEAELREMDLTYQCMLVRPDPIAKRRRELEYLRCMDKTSAFNDLSGRLPSSQPPLRRIRVCSLSQLPPGAARPYFAPISDVPPVTTCPEGPTIVRQKWSRSDHPTEAGKSRYYS